MASRIDGVALGCIAAGGLSVYAGIKGYSVPQVLQSVIQGKSPAALSQVTSVGTPTGSGSSGGSTGTTGSGGGTASAAASIALASVGHAYVFGGAPGKNFASPWDCSSAFNSWYTEAGLPIPSEPPFNGGASHGPPTTVWLVWTGATGIPKSRIQAGDILVWQTHMGIALGGEDMVSALNPSLGTRKTTIEEAAPAGEILFPRRLKQRGTQV